MIEPQDAFEKVMIEMVAKGLPQEIALRAIEDHRKILKFINEIIGGEGLAMAKQKFKQEAERVDRKFQEEMIKTGNIILNKFQEIRSRMN